MFGFGPWELLLIGVVVLVVLGPAMLPRLGRHLGRSVLGLRGAAESFTENVREEMEGSKTDAPESLVDSTSASAEPESKLRQSPPPAR